MSFAELSASYNHRTVSDRRLLFVQLLRREIVWFGNAARVLDIGCGEGIGEGEDKVSSLAAIRASAGELWGVEPDPSVKPTHGLFTQYMCGTLETADLPANFFDVAYSYFVMEHVSDPLAFCQTLHRVLRPGGVYIFMTPNARHYFVKFARWMRGLRLDEWYLRRARGRQLVDNYHYPTVYRFNDATAIGAIARRTGFAPPLIAYTEREVAADYFIGPLRAIRWLGDLKRRFWRDPECLLELTCRIQKISTNKVAHPPDAGSTFLSNAAK